jgi:hypothetical protein
MLGKDSECKDGIPSILSDIFFILRNKASKLNLDLIWTMGLVNILLS